ncbi:hypothetical protein [Microtetraspora sp. NBRC 16547]|uniref:hypothetical protein n=1 Tax=Microtetraspora sp. NBRC 16547 TaxID=3030993 RepID=UPI002557974E|nr:hypothetical protein [Microtetraspora sp. NBRC 16547]
MSRNRSGSSWIASVSRFPHGRTRARAATASRHRELNRLGGRKVPKGAPTSFVTARYAEYLDKAREAGDDTAFRHYWERGGYTAGPLFRASINSTGGPPRRTSPPTATCPALTIWSAPAGSGK